MDRSLLRRVGSPRSWPIAVKMTLLLIAASILPMVVTAAIDVRQARESTSKSLHDNLRRLAQTGAARIDQLLADTERMAAVVAGDAEVVELLATGEQKASASSTLANVARANADLAHVFLLDQKGTCVLSTRAAELGLSYAHRTYYQDALKDGQSISEVLTGVTSNKPGVYISHAVTHPERGVVGVAVLKLSGEAVARLVQAIKPSVGDALLVDSYGVVVANTADGLLYKSLTPLSPEVLALPVFDHRFTSVGVDHIQSLDVPEVAARLVRAKAPGEGDMTLPRAGREILGYAPVSANGWTLAVYEPESRLEEPLRRVTHRAGVNALLVGLAVTLIALVVARTIVRPMRRLTEAAQAIRRGDFRAVGAEVDHGEAGPVDEIGMLGESFHRMARGLAERERERDIFGRMVSPEVREKLLAGNLELGGETRRAVVLFSDIRGFSTLSEKMDPQAVVALLNEYLTAMAAATTAWNGYINNFIGDAIVVVFGAPVPQVDADGRAVHAAFAMRKALARLNETRAARGDAPIETGIGIAAGDMVAGQIGSPERMLYTVIGDAVNVAARLEALTKEYPGKHVLVTRAVADALATGSAHAESLGPILLKGRSEPVEVISLVE